MERKEPMTDKDLKELYLNNLHDLKNISNFLNLTEEQREKLVEEQDDAVKEESKPLIMAEIFAEADGTVPFMLRYQEASARWKPKYEVRYKSSEEPPNEMNGSVRPFVGRRPEITQRLMAACSEMMKVSPKATYLPK